MRNGLSRAWVKYRPTMPSSELDEKKKMKWAYRCNLVLSRKGKQVSRFMSSK